MVLRSSAREPSSALFLLRGSVREEGRPALRDVPTSEKNPSAYAGPGTTVGVLLMTTPWRDPTWVEMKGQARHQQEKLAKRVRDIEREKKNPKPRKKTTQKGLPEFF